VEKSIGNGRTTTIFVPPPPWVPDEIDQDLLRSAAAKRREKKQLNRAEAAVVRKAQAHQEERDRWKFYQSIPQKHWVQMSGRQAKVLREQAELYGIGFADAVIDLPRVVRQIHDFFAKHFRRFMQPMDATEEAVQGCSQSVKDEYVRTQIELNRLKIAQHKRELVPLEEFRLHMVRLGAKLNGGAERIQRCDSGSEAHAVLMELLDEFDADLVAAAAAGPDGSDGT
jgi:hypothetical protein